MSQKLLCESYLSQSKWDLEGCSPGSHGHWFTRSADKAIRVFFPQPPSLGDVAHRTGASTGRRVHSFRSCCCCATARKGTVMMCKVHWWGPEALHKLWGGAGCARHHQAGGSSSGTNITEVTAFLLPAPLLPQQARFSMCTPFFLIPNLGLN